MNDDLGDRPLDLGEPGNPGQSAASEVVRSEQFVRRSDLQALQNRYDTQHEQIRREAKEKVDAANVALAQANAIIEQAKIDNPDAVPGLMARARAAQLEAENAMLKAERQERVEQEQRQIAEYEKQRQDLEEARNWYIGKAPKYGVDPDSEEFQKALNMTLSDGDEWHVMEVLVRGKSGQGQAASVPQNTPVLPPSGGGPPHTLSEAQREALSSELIELYNEPTKNASKIAALKSRLGI